MTKIYEELTRYITENQNRYYRLAYRYVKEEQAALDVVQNAVLKALEHVQDLRNSAYMGTWLYRIVMNESMQTVIKLYYFEELTMPEIAAITGINLSTVKYRLYQGLQRLKRTMKEGVA